MSQSVRGQSSPADGCRLAACSGHLGDAIQGVRGTLGLQLVIGEYVLGSRLDLGAALVVDEARRCYLVVISV